MIGRLFANRYGGTVLGVILVLIGIFGFDSNKVMCGGQTMKPGDSCVEISKGNSTTRSYEEEKSRDHLYRYGSIGVGTLMFVIGAALIIKRHAGGSLPAQPAAATGGGKPQPEAQYPPS
ncbi:hypothetical protein AB0M46_22605 [Dactylosporangium sp. NPDC051485]|uniref:hypothetical protein n=1 Tax=Dactylosporangium sp. NPDC051485 TaxID=3154846 RepID=UPI0034409977